MWGARIVAKERPSFLDGGTALSKINYRYQSDVGMGRITVVKDLLSFRVVLTLSKKKESGRVSMQVLALLSGF